MLNSTVREHTLATARIQARILLKTFNNGTSEQRLAAAERLKSAPRFATLSAKDIAKAFEPRLKDAQEALAHEWGYPGWNALVAAHARAKSVPAAVEEARGVFADGYTEDDIARVLPTISDWCGLDVVCVWNAWDEFGAGGDSEFFVVDSDEMRPAPSIVNRFLFEPDSDIDPRALLRLAMPTTDAEPLAHDMGGCNFAHIVAGEEHEDEDLVAVEHCGVRIFHTLWKPNMLSEFHYATSDGEQFDIRDLDGFRPGTAHEELLREAIELGQIPTDEADDD